MLTLNTAESRMRMEVRSHLGETADPRHLSRQRRLASRRHRHLMLAAIAAGQNLAGAAQASGVSVSTVYREMRRRPRLALAVAIAREMVGRPRRRRLFLPPIAPELARDARTERRLQPLYVFLLPVAVILVQVIVWAIAAERLAYLIVGAAVIGALGIALVRMRRRWSDGPRRRRTHPLPAHGASGDLRWIGASIAPMSTSRAMSLRRHRR